MSKRKNIIILVLVFVLLIGSASVLYTQLSKDDAPDGLLIQGDQENNDHENQNDKSGTLTKLQYSNRTETCKCYLCNRCNPDICNN